MRWQGEKYRRVVLIASDTSWSTRGASYRVGYMVRSHTCLPCLPSERTLFWNDLLVAGRVVSREGEKGGRVVSWEGGKGGRAVRWQVSRGWRVVGWQVGKGGRIVSWKVWRG